MDKYLKLKTEDGGAEAVQAVLNPATQPLLTNPELFIGYVCPIGVDLKSVIRVTEDILIELGYQCYRIKLSTLISEISRYKDECILAEAKSEKDRLQCLMDVGDHLRRTTNRSSSVMMCGIPQVQECRRQKVGKIDTPLLRTAYLFDSIKHPEELKLLRSIYGKLFFSFSVSDTLENRVTSLAKRLAESAADFDESKHRGAAEELIHRDYKADGSEHGQNVRDAFPLSDAFVRVGNATEIRLKVQRVLETWFGHPYHTPTRDEYGMFFAKAASLRSADLSRQVGAAIVSDNGEIVAVGCNEVPHAFGNYIWNGPLSTELTDRRDFKVGSDSSVDMKTQIVSEVVKRFIDHNLIREEFSKDTVQKLVDELLTGERKKILKGTRVTSIIEFGRVVHAEMTAITEAARRGIGVRDTNLYSTTFPCHMCARHIILSGIKRVIYIEPYPKSMAKDLYKGIIAVDLEHTRDMVVFEAFEGVGPERYQEMYQMGEKVRKNSTGKVKKWEGRTAHPFIESFYGDYIRREKAISAYLASDERLVAFGHKKGQTEGTVNWREQHG